MRFAAKVLNFGYGLTEFWDVIRLHQAQFFNDVHGFLTLAMAARRAENKHCEFSGQPRFNKVDCSERLQRRPVDLNSS